MMFQLILILLLACLNLQAHEEVFLSDFDQGLNEARKQNKPLLIDFYHRW